MRIKRLRTIVILFFLFLSVSGCARLVVPDMPREDVIGAETRIERFARINKEIPPFNGIGDVRIVSGEGAWSFRGAWLGVPENRFRIETVGMAGQPGARLICDGAQCHFIYSENGCYRKISTPEKNLRHLAGIDMEVADLVVLLGGGVPVVDHDTAWMEGNGDPAGPVMVLKKRFYGEVGKIYFSPDTDRVEIIEAYGFRQLKYRAEIISTRVVDGYVVPDILRIENDDAAMVLNVSRAGFGVSYPADAFVPAMPENDRCDF